MIHYPPPGDQSQESPLSVLAGGAALPFVISHLGGPSLAKWVSRGIAVAAVFRWLSTRLEKQADGTQLTFQGNRASYRWVVKWLDGQTVEYDGTQFEVDDDADGNSAIEVPCGTRPDGEETPVRKARMFPAKAFNVSWHGLSVHVTQSRESRSDDTTSERRSFSWETIDMTVPTRDRAMIQELLDEISAAGQSDGSCRNPQVYTWNYRWQHIRRCPPDRRVVLPGDTYAQLKADLQRFLSGREWCEERGIPWRRGYLLHGIAGGGKSTTVQVLAGALGLDIYLMNLARMDDEALLEAISRTPVAGAIILIEDADCAFDNGNRNQREARVTMSALLNAIDGVATPDGRIVFMTTNHVERIDPALIRPGRIDKRVEFSHANGDQITQLAMRFGLSEGDAGRLALRWESEELSMASVQERLITLTTSP